MNDFDQMDMDRLIEEASALPADHVDRGRLLTEIDRRGETARQAWLERSGSYEALRERFGDVTPPAHLEEALLAIPDSTSPQRLIRGARRGRWVVAAAALIALLVLGVVMQTLRTEDNSFDTLAALMVEDHRSRPALTVPANEPAVIERELNKADKLAVRVPDLGESFDLVGGRLCKFDRAPLAYTRWEHRGMEHSLYQVERTRFSLPDRFATREITVPALPGESDGVRVLIWQEGDFVYGLVCPHPESSRS